jgi:hypothetical protein
MKLDTVISVRLSSAELEMIRERAEAEQRKPGDLIRVAALRPWLQTLKERSATLPREDRPAAT